MRKLYLRNMKKALKEIQRLPDIVSGVPRQELQNDFTTQLAKHPAQSLHTKLWNACTEGIELMASPFKEHRICTKQNFT